MAPYSAISVKNVVKKYGSKIILDGLCMNVERGTIYGLLGPSGCGKTTLLGCMIGRKNVDSGDIWILGGRPGEKGCGIPGPRLGYMPQELALVEEFTVKDAIYYFGTIFKMKPDEIKEQLEYLSKLLELPAADKYLKHCSGGEKRRVSFAVALVQSPELLILDEPTVGVDPILREKIWDHLKDIVEKKRITVILTTHYIEETNQANTIGLMRCGKLLTEESPNTLLSTFQKSTLEEVFFILSQRQEKQLTHKHDKTIREESNVSLDPISASTSVESVVADYGSRDELTKSKERKTKRDQAVYMSATDLDRDRMKALLDKNFKQFYRNIGGILFLLTFPIFQMLFFTNSIGNDPRHLNLGIVNNESMTTLCSDFAWNETALYSESEDNCRFRDLACRFLTYLEHPMINKVLYDSFPEAIDGVKHGEILGILYIPTNFSETFEERIRLGTDVQPWTIEYGEIKAYMDMSNRLTGATLAIKLHKLFVSFQENLLVDCNFSRKLGSVPIQQHFLFGHDEQPMTVFVAPGMVILLIFLLGSTMTSQIIIKEKMDGVWERSIIAGVSSLEITLSHLLIQCVIMLVECVEIMLMIDLVPGIDIAGNRWTLFFLLYLQGVCGMSYGFLVSAACETSGEANILCTGGYLPMTMICGIIWPIEAMPAFLKWISLGSPSTLAILSFRNVMSKAFHLWDPLVINGFGVTLGWIIFLGISSVWVIKLKR